MKKVFKLLLSLLIVLSIFGCTKQEDTTVTGQKTIKIAVFDKNNAAMFEKDVTTDKEYLVEVLEDLAKDGSLTVQLEDSQYGKYIDAFNGVKQENNYYWNYYVNDDYASVGISECVLKQGDVYTFKLEKFE